MRIRMTLALLAAAAGLAACSSSGSRGGDNNVSGTRAGSPTSVPATTAASPSPSAAHGACAKVQAALDSVGQLNSILSDPTEAGAGPKFDAAIAALKQIGTDAPADVRNAAAHLTGALAKGKTEIVGGHPDLGDIGMLATTVATDNRVLVDYVIKDCSGS